MPNVEVDTRNCCISVPTVTIPRYKTWYGSGSFKAFYHSGLIKEIYLSLFSRIPNRENTERLFDRIWQVFCSQIFTENQFYFYYFNNSFLYHIYLYLLKKNHLFIRAISDFKLILSYKSYEDAKSSTKQVTIYWSNTGRISIKDLIFLTKTFYTLV